MGTQQVEQRHQGGQGIGAFQAEDTEWGPRVSQKATVIQCVVQQAGWGTWAGLGPCFCHIVPSPADIATV